MYVLYKTYRHAKSWNKNTKVLLKLARNTHIGHGEILYEDMNGESKLHLIQTLDTEEQNYLVREQMRLLIATGFSKSRTQLTFSSFHTMIRIFNAKIVSVLKVNPATDFSVHVVPIKIAKEFSRYIFEKRYIFVSSIAIYKG